MYFPESLEDSPLSIYGLVSCVLCFVRFVYKNRGEVEQGGLVFDKGTEFDVEIEIHGFWCWVETR